MTYQANRTNGKVISIQRFNDDGTQSSIPLDPANSDYQAFLVWNQTAHLDLSDQPYTPPQDDLDMAAARTDIVAQYVAAVARLTQIIGATNPTNAQVVSAVQDMAGIQLKVLKALKWLI
jgi:hypothetical protein